MALNLEFPGVDDTTLDWLLESDPAIRWQVLRDLTDAPLETVARERARVSTEGWGARLLGLQRPDGHWGDGERLPQWWTNLYTMVWLRDLGVDPVDETVRKAVARVDESVTWEWHGHAPFFEGEVEPCINGRVVALGAYFRKPVDGVVARLLEEQLSDGGWNCEAERGSVRSSFHTTICVLEGLLAYERMTDCLEDVASARKRAEEYLLERRLMRRLGTGEVIDPSWGSPAFPPLWHYDVLRALDYLRSAASEPDPRVDDGARILIEARRANGRWSSEVRHRDTLYEEMAGAPGVDNRWVTLLALRVMKWLAHGQALEPDGGGPGGADMSREPGR